MNPIGVDISRSWTDRLAYENRISAKKGWNVPRQIRLTKRICEIVGGDRAAGVVVGGGIEDIRKHLDPESDTPNEMLYSMCFKMCLLQIASLMRSYLGEGLL